MEIKLLIIYYQNRSKIDGIKEKIIQSDTKSKKDATTVPSENDSRFYQKHWYQEEYSGKVFEASEKEIMEAILELNKQLQLNGYVTLQEFLKFLLHFHEYLDTHKLKYRDIY